MSLVFMSSAQGIQSKKSLSFSSMTNYSVIIVTHNSEAFLADCLAALRKQLIPPLQIIVVDSASRETAYLTRETGIQLLLQNENVGFCKGNNIGYSQASADFVLFLNPDAFLPPSFMKEALSIMQGHPRIGALSGLLLGYDLHKKEATGRIDSSGIFRSWYGKWYDRDQGKEWKPKEMDLEAVPALCGALMLCRQEALKSVLLGPGEVMDERFYMYKEDIDLSLRLRKKGWQLTIAPQLIAYHCRGWNKQRKSVPKKFRLLSARNEVRLHARMKSPCILYSLAKYLAVRGLNI